MEEFSCVEYEGVLPFKETAGFFRRIRVGMSTLLPVGQYDRIDNLPTKVFEYMGSGLPVILSDNRASRRLAEESGCCVCVDPEDEAQMALAIRTLLDDPERAAEMGNRGFRAATEHYNWTNEEKKLINLYRELTL